MPLVNYEKRGRVAIITLNRPEHLNAIDFDTAGELARIWMDFRDDNDIWVAILKGEGRSFCAGADVTKMDLGGKWDMEKSIIYGKNKIGPSNYKVWKPIIAALHGHVLGAGFYLALECDIRIASEDAQLGLPEPMVNIPTMFTPFLRDYLPSGLAIELLLVGDRINAKRAYEIGLVSKVVPRDKLMSASESMAERLLQNGPLCLRAMKEVFHRTRDMDSGSAMSLIEHLFIPVMNSYDAAEGKRAFQEKRKPEWKCR
jgi:enoyl-CoA hydratase/carnithine racemase